MNHLTLFTKPTATPNRFEVYWRNGVQKQGLVTVAVQDKNLPTDLNIAAELCAAQYLLERKNIFGKDRTGKNLFLSVSSGGAIRKLAKLQSAKTHLLPYAKFLFTRFVGIDIKVDSDSEWIKPRALNDTAMLEINGPMPEFIHINGVGDVIVTVHVIERLNQRLNYPGEHEVMKYLRKIASQKIEAVLQTDDELERAKCRHGIPGEIFYAKEMRCKLIVVRDKGIGYLATIYFS